MIHDPSLSVPDLEIVSRNPREILKKHILKDRLALSVSELETLLKTMKDDLAGILGVSPKGIDFDAQFSGRELDFLFTLDLQNLPPPKRTT